MSKNIYPIAFGDMSVEEYRYFCWHPHFCENIGAVYNGEFRCPKKGEWYLSGATPTAYKAPNNLSMKYHIARLVLYKKVTQYEIIE